MDKPTKETRRGEDAAVAAVRMWVNAENAIKDEIDRGGIKKLTPELQAQIAHIAAINSLTMVVEQDILPALNRIAQTVDTLSKK